MTHRISLKLILLLSLNVLFTAARRIPYNRQSNSDLDTLSSLFIVHRHGDRTIISTFPNDPYVNESYWPDGWGELTEGGKSRMYSVGRFLRSRYDGFLTDNIREVMVRSSGIERCLESTQLVLNGMYNPNGRWIWDPKEPWQPFPVHTTFPPQDSMLNPDADCPAADHEQTKIMNSDYVRKLNEANQDLFNTLSANCGENISNLMAAEYVFDSLKIEQIFNYEWPSWVTDDLYQRLAAISDQSFFIEFMTRAAQRFRTGVFFKDLKDRITKNLERSVQRNMASVYNSFSNDAWKKVFVYSSHDTFVAAVLNALGVFNDFAPPFGATVLFELHQPIDSSLFGSAPFIRTYYLNETETQTLHPMRLPVCEFNVECSIDQFFEGINDLIIEDWHKECHKQSDDGLSIGMPDQVNLDSEVITLTLVGLAVSISMLMLLLFCCFLRQRHASFVYQLLPTV